MKTIYVVNATRGHYSDRTEHVVCWYPDKESAETCARRMLDASAEWRTHVNNSKEPYVEVWDRARAAIGDPCWSPSDDTEYGVEKLERGK